MKKWIKGRRHAENPFASKQVTFYQLRDFFFFISPFHHKNGVSRIIKFLLCRLGNRLYNMLSSPQFACKIIRKLSPTVIDLQRNKVQIDVKHMHKS